ncbi:hypothetical protein ACLB1N_05125 [Escherichia coli]
MPWCNWQPKHGQAEPFSRKAVIPLGQAYTKAESDERYQLKNAAGKAANGWFKDASTGFMIQWGLAPGFNRAVNFPTAFPLTSGSMTVREVMDNGDEIQNFLRGFIK